PLLQMPLESDIKKGTIIEVTGQFWTSVQILDERPNSGRASNFLDERPRTNDPGRALGALDERPIFWTTGRELDERQLGRACTLGERALWRTSWTTGRASTI
ncbi:hypothetical protein VIGAN_04273800, partial [Vigna angularis var. angularis]